MLFVCVTAFANDFVFGVEFVGSKVYARETYQALEEYGIRIGKKYKGENVDLVCARLLSMDGVEFCSVKKKGMKLYVDVRTDAYQKKNFYPRTNDGEPFGRAGIFDGIARHAP